MLQVLADYSPSTDALIVLTQTLSVVGCLLGLIAIWAWRHELFGFFTSGSARAKTGKAANAAVEAEQLLDRLRKELAAASMRPGTIDNQKIPERLVVALRQHLELERLLIERITDHIASEQELRAFAAATRGVAENVSRHKNLLAG